jgi:MFS family permease
VLLLVGGAVVDRVSARSVLLGAHLVRAVAVGGLALLSAAGGAGAPAFLAAAVLVGAADAFAGPAGVTVLPALVPAARLPRANALVATSEQVAFAAGPLGAGALIALSGPAAALAADAGTFLLAAGTVLAAPTVRTSAGSPLWTDIGAGLRWAARTAEVRAVLLVVAAATLSYADCSGSACRRWPGRPAARSGSACCSRPGASASWSARSRPGSPGCRGAGGG